MSVPTKRNWLRACGALLAGICAVAGFALAPAGVFAQRVLLQPDAFAETIGPLREDPNVQDVILTAVDQHVNQYIDELAHDSGPLSGLIEGARPWLTSAIESSTEKTMATKAYAQEWDAAVADAHAQAIAVLDGTQEPTGKIVLHAGPLADLVAADAVSALPIAVTVPAMTVDLSLVRADTVAQYQDAYALIARYGYVPLIVAAAAGVLAIALARNRWRALAVLSFAVALVAAVAAVAITVASPNVEAGASSDQQVAAHAIELLGGPLTNAQWFLAGGGALVGLVALVVARARRPRPVEMADKPVRPDKDAASTPPADTASEEPDLLVEASAGAQAGQDERSS